jgi:hypothetical protein
MLGDGQRIKEAATALGVLGLRSEAPLTEEPEELDSAGTTPLSESDTPPPPDSKLDGDGDNDAVSPLRANLPPLSLPQSDLARLHENFDRRLLSFFGIKLASKRLCITVYHGDTVLASGTTLTSLGGEFSRQFDFSWDAAALGPRPATLQVVTELLTTDEDGGGAVTPPRMSESSSSSSGDYSPRESATLAVTNHGLTHVLSDIDDTVKRTAVLDGVRAIFHNVFAKDYSDIQVRALGTTFWGARTTGG